jgi:hypothetical protein
MTVPGTCAARQRTIRVCVVGSDKPLLSARAPRSVAQSSTLHRRSSPLRHTMPPPLPMSRYGTRAIADHVSPAVAVAVSCELSQPHTPGRINVPMSWSEHVKRSTWRDGAAHASVATPKDDGSVETFCLDDDKGVDDGGGSADGADVLEGQPLG